MKNGLYKVTFYVQLNNCSDIEEAELEIAALVSEALEEDAFPEITLELEEEEDIEYNTEENELEELDFEEAV